jgi:hypothetical protein
MACVPWKRLKQPYESVNDPNFKFHCNYSLAVCVFAMLHFYTTIKIINTCHENKYEFIILHHSTFALASIVGVSAIREKQFFILCAYIKLIYHCFETISIIQPQSRRQRKKRERDRERFYSVQRYVLKTKLIRHRRDRHVPPCVPRTIM